MDIVGAVLIFIYGLPSPLSQAGSYVVIEASKDEKKEVARYNVFAGVGLALLILGFTFQLISNFIPTVY